jgi:hypothetical protein
MPSYTVKTDCAAAAVGYNNHRSLARKSNGDLWCVYSHTDGETDQIYVSYSTDGGVTWTEEQVSYAPAWASIQKQPTIAIDSLDNIHVVWAGDGWGDYTTKTNIQYRKRTTSWQTQEAVTNVDHYLNGPAIAIDSEDNIHVVFYGYEDVWTSIRQIQYCQKTTSWQALEVVTSINNHQYYPSIAIDSSDNVHIVWFGANWPGVGSAFYNIQYRKRTTSWQTQEAVTDIAEAQKDPCIAVDSEDNIYVVWTGRGLGDNPTIENIYFRERTTSWQTIELVSDKDPAQYYPSIAIDSLDNIQVAWIGTGWGVNSGWYNILYREKTIDGWQVTDLLTDLAINHEFPIFIWASQPTLYSIVKTNRTKTGYTLIWSESTTVKFYNSDDLTWSFLGPTINPYPSNGESLLYDDWAEYEQGYRVLRWEEIGDPPSGYWIYFKKEGGGYGEGVFVAGQIWDFLNVYTTEPLEAGDYYWRVDSDYLEEGAENAVPGTEWTFTILSPNIAPEITDQPDSITVSKGQLASFTIAAIGTPLPTYQWCKDENPISGKTTSTLTFYCDFADAGSYTCIVTNAVGSATSDPATLTVVSNPWRYNLFKLQSDIDRN